MQKLTNSARNKFAACHRAYQLFYVQGKRPVIPSDALGFGTAMHALLEGVWGGSSSRANGEGDGGPSFNTGDPYRDMTLKALYEGYLDRWERDDDERFEKVAAEVYFEAPLMNPETGGISKTWVLAGKIDAIAREKATGKLYIIEHKTTSQDIGPGSDYWRRLAIDGQVSGYYVGAQANGYEVDLHTRYYDLSAEGKDLPAVPSPEGTILMLSAHILKHAMGPGVGLRQICDMAMACRSLTGRIDTVRLRKYFRSSGTTRWNRMLCSLIHIRFGLDTGFFPGEKPRRFAPLEKIVFAGGNFGHYSQSRKKALFRSARARKVDTAFRLVRRIPFSLHYAPKEYTSYFISLIKGNLFP